MPLNTEHAYKATRAAGATKWEGVVRTKDRRETATGATPDEAINNAIAKLDGGREDLKLDGQTDQSDPNGDPNANPPGTPPAA